MIEIPLVKSADPRARELLHPHFHLAETERGYRCEATLPGVLEEDLHVSIEKRTLKVRGRWHLEHKEETESSYAYDSAGGGFTRLFHLPEPVDAEGATAELSGGLLTVEIPKQRPGEHRPIAVRRREQEE